MKRLATVVLAGAMAASVIGLSEVASAGTCVDGGGFRTCGEHVRLGALPLHFKINASSRPSNLTTPEVIDAAAAAIQSWNIAWPLPSGDPLCRALCLDGTTGKSGAARDGQNTISWSADFGGCGNAHAGVGVACIWYEGTTGVARDRIAEVDIILSAHRSWYQPFIVNASDPLRSAPEQVIAGEAATVYPELGDNSIYDLVGDGQGRYDVQSAITHELGHALGLEDIGDPAAPWPNAVVSDASSYQQTMYRWYYRGTTSKRSLAEGDIAGLQVVAAFTASDV